MIQGTQKPRFSQREMGFFVLTEEDLKKSSKQEIWALPEVNKS